MERITNKIILKRSKKMETEKDYDEKAFEFLEKTNTEYKADFWKIDKYFDDDKEERAIFNITLKRGNRVFTFTFGQSLADTWIIHDGAKIGRYMLFHNKLIFVQAVKEWKAGRKDKTGFWVEPNRKPPTPYSVLAAITKQDPGSFEEFCSDFGCDTDSRKAEKIYQAVKHEFKELQRLYNDYEIERLAKIE